MNLCPSSMLLRATKIKDGEFDPYILDLIEDENIVRIKAIRVNTPYEISIKLLVCHTWKDQAKNYCDKFCNPKAEKKLCESNKTNYVYFYVNKPKQEGGNSEGKPALPVYLLVFTRYTHEYDKISPIVREIKKTAKWLGIEEDIIQCYIFFYSTSALCNSTDRGSFKKYFATHCPDENYSFQFQYIPKDENPKWLCINEGKPRFSMAIQDMRPLKD